MVMCVHVRESKLAPHSKTNPPFHQESPTKVGPLPGSVPPKALGPASDVGSPSALKPSPSRRPRHSPTMEPAPLLRIRAQDLKKWPPSLIILKRASLTVIRTSPSQISHMILNTYVSELLARVIASSPTRPRPHNQVPSS